MCAFYPIIKEIDNDDEDDVQVIDDWRYVSLVMDRLLMYIYMIVTLVATCTILIKTSVFEFFDQGAFKEAIALERDCKDDVLYRPKCHRWYSEICLDEHNNLHPFIVTHGGAKITSACNDYIQFLKNQ